MNLLVLRNRICSHFYSSCLVVSEVNVEMEDSSSLDPHCIILVKSGAHGGKLLFRYPFNNLSPHPSSPNNVFRENPYAMTISEDLLNERVNVEPTNY